MCARSPVTWWASLSSIRSGWVWGCGPASQAVNGGVCEACSGALELSASLWAKSKDWAREGPAPRSSSPASRAELRCSSALSPNWQIWVLKKKKVVSMLYMNWDENIRGPSTPAHLGSDWRRTSASKCYGQNAVLIWVLFRVGGCWAHL